MYFGPALNGESAILPLVAGEVPGVFDSPEGNCLSSSGSAVLPAAPLPGGPAAPGALKWKAHPSFFPRAVACIGKKKKKRERAPAPLQPHLPSAFGSSLRSQVAPTLKPCSSGRSSLAVQSGGGRPSTAPDLRSAKRSLAFFFFRTPRRKKASPKGK